MNTYKKILFTGGVLLLLTGCFFVRAKITGRVVMLMPNGETAALPDAKVELWTTGGEYLDTATVDMEGNYTFSRRVPMGTYIIKVKPGSFLGFKEKQETVRVLRSIVQRQIRVEPLGNQ